MAECIVVIFASSGKPSKGTFFSMMGLQKFNELCACVYWIHFDFFDGRNAQRLVIYVSGNCGKIGANCNVLQDKELHNFCWGTQTVLTFLVDLVAIIRPAAAVLGGRCGGSLRNDFYILAYLALVSKRPS